MKHQDKVYKSGIVLFGCFAIFLLSCGGGGGDGDGGDINTPPIAKAGHDFTALNNALVVLDGSASSDADGDPLIFNWTMVSKPLASAATLANFLSPFPSFTADVAGNYVITLVVNDGMANSVEDSVLVTVIPSVSAIRDTGQGKCYNNTTEIACVDRGNDFYGQDAQYSTNPLRLVDNGSMVMDTITGLTWQKGDSGTRYNWYQAMGIFNSTFNPGTIDVCGSLALGGFSDWRVPSRRELVSLLNYAQGQGTVDSFYFQSSGSDYWSSTTTLEITDVAWGVTGGRVSYGFGSAGGSALYVRCVRGPLWGQNSMVDNGDGTVTDIMSGLIWQRSDDGVARNWQDALAYCENLSLANHSSWRLPDIKELESLVAINSSNETPLFPAIDTNNFPTTKMDRYWSSTTVAEPANFAWVVDFAIGWVDWDPEKVNFLFTRCVR